MKIKTNYKKLGEIFAHILKKNGSISVYKDVIVFWDDDEDNRVFELIDILEHLTERLPIAVGESKAFVFAFWNRFSDVEDLIKSEDELMDIQLNSGDVFNLENYFNQPQ